MIELIDVNKSFGDNQILFDLNAKFEEGKVNLIIGQSGHGKSVLTKCIVGLHTPEAGKILFNDRDFVQMNDHEKKDVRKEIGMLFQGSALFDSLTVEENIMFPLQMFTDMSKQEMLDRANFCLERVNMTGSNKLFPSECSGGMMKRVAIARAISLKPRYLFCDEPNSGLDPKTSIVIDNLIKEITYELNITTIVVTHDMNSVIEIGDNITFIHKGRKEWEGTKQDILKTENKAILDFVYASQFMKQLKGKLSS